ncbi:MAG TPA: type II toxin-antitoxin system RelE/ParE family toxin [Isosphaeraceae bacterium]|nr:type II toxin-antitoxin system RelE/ParE family toxin [Isosphaeraceae bacterium]
MILEVADDAVDEVVGAARYYNNQRVGLGQEFLASLDAGYQEIQAHPHRYPKVNLRRVAPDTHLFLLDRFPYQIIYRVETDRIFVVAVAHTRRRQGYWRKRG